MPRPRREVVIKKSRLTSAKSGSAGVYVVTGVVAVGALVAIWRLKAPEPLVVALAGIVGLLAYPG